MFINRSGWQFLPTIPFDCLPSLRLRLNGQNVAEVAFDRDLASGVTTIFDEVEEVNIPHLSLCERTMGFMVS